MAQPRGQCGGYPTVKRRTRRIKKSKGKTKKQLKKQVKKRGGK